MPNKQAPPRKIVKISRPSSFSLFSGITLLRRITSSGWMTLCLLLILTGCTLPADKTSLPVPSGTAEPTVEPETIDARELLETAIEQSNTSDITQSFWFNGYVRNALQHSHVTSMFDGVTLRPKDAFIVNGRIAAQPFQYYGYEGERYINSRSRWYALSDEDQESLPFDPFFGFADWLPLMEEAVQLPDDAVLGNLSDVIEVKINAKEWVERSPANLFTELREQLASSEDLKRVMEETVVKTTFWIGKEDRIIYQYQTWMVTPLPGGGYFDQQTYFRFYRHGDPAIETTHLPKPERVRQYIRDSEQELIEDDMVDA